MCGALLSMFMWLFKIFRCLWLLVNSLRRFSSLRGFPCHLGELKVICLEELAKTEPQCCQLLIALYHRCLEAVISKNVSVTKSYGHLFVVSEFVFLNTFHFLHIVL